MRSIRLKLTLGAALLFAGGIGLLIAANLLFLEPFYALEARSAFEGIRRSMERVPPDESSLLRAAQELAQKAGCKVDLVDPEGFVRLSSVPEFRPGRPYPFPRDQLESFLSRRAGIARGEVFFGVLDRDPNAQSVIQLVAAAGGGLFLVVTQPLDGVRRNIAVASRFSLLVGVFVLLAVFALVLAASGSLARPILELSSIAQRVAAGDLSARFARRRDDELGLLGGSLDAMASALARNIEELRAANHELGLEMKAQERFIAGASHELKTPVGLVRGYAEALRLGLYGSDAERDELADVILKEADHLDRLVRDLANIAALRGSERSLLLSEGDFRATVAEAVERFALEAAKKGIVLRFEGGGPLPARYDRDRIVQVVDNLLSNGIRHSRERGAIAVRVDDLGDGIGLEVENQGEVVPEEHLPCLFEPFYRVDSSRARNSGGSGLGLAVVRSVVEAHGGSCGVRNTARGVLFWVRLPVAGPAPAPALTASSSAAPPPAPGL